MRTLILAKNGFVSRDWATDIYVTSKNYVATIMSNLAHYGFVPSKEVYEYLNSMGDESIKMFWGELEPVLKGITGDSKNMGEHVVYKNFPQEVLDMTATQYWISQILMYWGVANENFTQDAKSRDSMFEKLDLKVLALEQNDTYANIYKSLCKTPARWTDEQFSFVKHFIVTEDFDLAPSTIPFKENLVKILGEVIALNKQVKLRSAMDVLRLGIALSDGDITFATNSKFRNFKRSERRYLLDLLNNASNLEEDMARNKEVWKRFLRNLHPGDYKTSYKNVVKAARKLYNDKVHSFNGLVEMALEDEDIDEVLKLLISRPGDFVRRFHKVYETFGNKVVKAADDVLGRLTTLQLLKFKKYLINIDNREKLAFAPKGNWINVKIVDNNKSEIKDRDKVRLIKSIDQLLALRLNNRFPNGVNLQDSADLVKVQGNDASLTPYGRGTRFPIPDNVNFLRSASYWKHKDRGNVWFDNGWNFFDDNWLQKGAICWNTAKMSYCDGAVFSGDPTNSKTKDGKACQMIDLYIDKLLQSGIRYAVWNILCYSNIPFSEAKEVFAALQWGEDAQSGKLFEPARCQLAFPIRDNVKTKYIAYLDLESRELVYIDVSFKTSVQSANSNCIKLQEVMPAFLEYVNTIPTIYDLFENAKTKSNGTVVTYSDEELEILDGDEAYVFKPLNEDNEFTPINISEILAEKGNEKKVKKRSKVTSR